MSDVFDIINCDAFDNTLAVGDVVAFPGSKKHLSVGKVTKLTPRGATLNIKTPTETDGLTHSLWVPQRAIIKLESDYAMMLVLQNKV